MFAGLICTTVYLWQLTAKANHSITKFKDHGKVTKKSRD
jgi:hypothetical protein